jgi:uncharacterized protein
MKIPRPLISALAALALFLPAFASAEEASYPAPVGFVNDFAGVLSPAAEAKIADSLRELDQKTSAEVAVYIVGTTSPETIESYAVTLFKNWRWPGAAKPGIGKEGKDNGVLLLVAIGDRKMRIEVGYGLEGTIPDAVAKRIVENLLLPRFREKKFDEGIAAATEALAALIAGESAEASAGLQPTPAVEEKPATAAGFMVPLAVFLGVIGFIVAIVILVRKGGGSAGSAGSGGSGGHSGSSSGGWSSGGGSSGGSSGGGSSFGGSGGGRSGGGGASGSW